jgi:putative acyl-CoA dehydrogenase
MSIWEGSGNVIALDVMRALRRDPASLEAFDGEVSRASGSSSVFDHHLTMLRRELAGVVTAESGAERHMRRLTEHMALALQASLLIRHAPDVVADAFVASRLGADRGYEYGTLPASTDVTAIVARHAGG